MQNGPRARVGDLATEEIDGGILAYDLKSNQVHWLDASATSVWRLADGTRSLGEIALRCALTEAVVDETLTRLEALELVEPKVEQGVTRRLAIRRVAVAGGAVAFAGPLISSILAPTAAMANTATCDAFACTGTASGACSNGKAKNNADLFCQTQSGGRCRSTSTCVGTCTGSSTFTGLCSF